MNVCYFVGDISKGGGIEKVTTSTVNILSQNKKLSIYVLSLYQSADHTFYQVKGTVTLKFLLKESEKGSKVKILYRLSKFISKYDIDVVINVDVILGIYSIPQLLLHPSVKLISWDHFSTKTNVGVQWYSFIRRLCLIFSEKYIVLTSGDKENLSMQFKSSNKIEVLPNPLIDCKQKSIYDTDNKIIISVGNFYYDKGFDIAIEVSKYIFKKHPCWKWHFYGDGPELQVLKERVQQEGLSPNIAFKGRVKNIEAAYENAAIFVLTSRNEGFGLVLLEAKAHRLPTVAFDVPYGPKSIIRDRIDGFVIKPFDVVHMANTINSLIEDDELRQSLSSHSFDNLEDFSLDNYIAHWNKILEL